MDYKKELETIENYQQKEYFKPEAGTYKLVIISEPVETEFNDGDKKIPQIEVDVSVNEEIKKWAITKGLTIRSLYGQIVKLAVMNKNSLVGVKFTLFVKGEGQKKDYTIPEVIEEK